MATTEDFRSRYVEDYGSHFNTHAEDEFDRWLNSVKADAWDEGQEGGWESRDRDASAGWIPSGLHESDAVNPYRTGGAE